MMHLLKYQNKVGNLFMANSEYEFTMLLINRSRENKKMPGGNASDAIIYDPIKKCLIRS